ncbi:MAG: aspartate aminotransferase family protein [Actinobacteria bacterium]|nr:aspartate aminotransferase family protein [Actinomycetota bacterium]
MDQAGAEEAGIDPAGEWGFGFDAAGLRLAVELLGAAAAPPPDPRPVPEQTGPGLPELLPEVGVGPEEALRQLAGPALTGATRLGDPGFFAHMDPPTPWVTWAAALWAASRNQNLLHPDTAPAARTLERLVVGWLAPFLGMRGGHLVPGSSVANLTGLWAAREVAGVREVVCSELAHLSVRKAAHILGLGFRTVPATADHRLDADAVGDVSHAALVLTAGTVAAGAIDPLGMTAGAARAGAAWLHVDAAWGGPLRLTRTHAALLDGIERADSVSLSAHKWLFQPKESAAVLFADVATAHEAISFGGGYLSVPNVGVLGSHGASALPLVATLLAWGRSGVEARLDRCMVLAEELADRIEAEPELELFTRPSTGVVLWRPARWPARWPAGTDLGAVRSRLTRSFVSLTEVRGEQWFRSVAANPMADPARVVDDMRAACR